MKEEQQIRRPFEDKIEKQVPHGTEAKDAGDHAGDDEKEEKDDGRSHT